MENIKANFDLETVEGQMRLFNAKNGSSISLKDVTPDTVIRCVGVLQYPDVTDTYGKEQEVEITVLFDKDGRSFASVSESVANAGTSLLDFFANTDIKEVGVMVVKGKSKSGNDYLNLQITK